MKKRILSAFLVLCMMLTMVPTAALAAEDSGGGNGSDRVHTESNDGVVVDKTVNYDEDGNYSLTLEAYVTNEVTKGSKTTPLDIVLVLDLSGSMDQNITSYTYEATSKRNWSYNDIDRQSQYYYFDGTSYYAVQRERSDRYWDWDEFELVRDYSLYYVDDSGSRHYLGNETRSQNAAILEDTVLYIRRSGGSISKIAAMKNAVGNFIDQVTANATGDPATNEDDVTHPPGFFQFSGKGSEQIGKVTFRSVGKTYN